ncbi:MAG: hypothetical protein K2Y10_10975 [Burkholderiaceae bacterium]|nr:hypothetical protein [Burkholderiaceae bacterium]
MSKGMTQQQYDALLSEFDDSPSRLKGWAYRIVASAKNGQRISQEQLAAAKLVVRFIEQEQRFDVARAAIHQSGDRYGALGYDARLVAVHTARSGTHGARPVRYVAGATRSGSGTVEGGRVQTSAKRVGPIGHAARIIATTARAHEVGL